MTLHEMRCELRSYLEELDPGLAGRLSRTMLERLLPLARRASGDLGDFCRSMCDELMGPSQIVKEIHELGRVLEWGNPSFEGFISAESIDLLERLGFLVSVYRRSRVNAKIDPSRWYCTVRRSPRMLQGRFDIPPAAETIFQQWQQTGCFPSALPPEHFACSPKPPHEPKPRPAAKIHLRRLTPDSAEYTSEHSGRADHDAQ